MKIGEDFFVAVWKDTGEVVGHPEGYVMSESRKIVQSELRCWKPVIGLEKMSDIEIKKVRFVETEDENNEEKGATSEES